MLFVWMYWFQRIDFNFMAIKFDMGDHTWIVGGAHQVSIVKCMVSQHYLVVVTLSGSNLKVLTWCKSLQRCFNDIRPYYKILQQAWVELGQAQLQLDLGFTLIKICCIILMITNYHYISLSTISLWTWLLLLTCIAACLIAIFHACLLTYFPISLPT